MKIESIHPVDAEQQRLDWVVVAAAATAVCGQPAEIRIAAGRNTGAWTREGRLAIQTSRHTTAPLIGKGRARGASGR